RTHPPGENTRRKRAHRTLAQQFHHSRRKIREILATPEPKPYVRLKFSWTVPRAAPGSSWRPCVNPSAQQKLLAFTASPDTLTGDRTEFRSHVMAAGSPSPLRLCHFGRFALRFLACREPP